MRYILFDERKHEIFNEEFDDLKEAIKRGDWRFNYLNDYDRKKCLGFYLLETVNPDEAAENHFDGNIVKRWL